MTMLVADRFMKGDGRRAIDLATGDAVTVRIRAAGTRDEQRIWTTRCARLLGVEEARPLIDYGFIGRARRFEAHRTTAGSSRRSSAGAALVAMEIEAMAEWLEHGGSGSRLIRLVSDEPCITGWFETAAREVRLRGFVPVRASLIQRHAELPGLLAGRSVVVFDDRPGRREGRAALCPGILRLLAASVREIFAVVIEHREQREQRPRSSDGGPPLGAQRRAPALTQRAAERRPAYGEARRTPVIVDPRAAAWLDEGRRLVEGGRHAAGERALRAASAALARRGDSRHEADGLMLLGRLLLARGRAAEAERQFAQARHTYQESGAARAALAACSAEGIAQTDQGRFEGAETTLRAAVTAANALEDQDAAGEAGVGLARNFYWQCRIAEGLEWLRELKGHDSPRYWCQAVKLQLAAGHLTEACQSAAKARDSHCAADDAGAEVLVRTAQALVQARMGDIDALWFHAQAGIAAARAAHLPLQALRLRLVVIEGLLNAGLQGRARALGRSMGGFRRLALPHVLKERIAGLEERLAEPGCKTSTRAVVVAAQETAPIFLPDRSETVAAVAELLAACHAADDERAGLTCVADIVRKQTAAIAVGIFTAGPDGPLQHAASGTMGATLARRCMELGQVMAPERAGSGVEGAVPVIHMGRIVGAVGCRWTVDGPRGSHDAFTFARIAAAACAPLLQILLERSRVDVQPDSADGTELIGISGAMQDVRRLIARASGAPFTVLIEGESGVGKELVARAIHRTGSRRDKPLRALNCAALTEELVDSELFGHARGAFTGALSERLGLFESAEGGSVFLDEVGELSSRAQAKLLRALQEGEIRRIGENFTRPIDTRLIAATNRSLAADVQAGRFRQDLLYRLDVIRITVPSLRERIEDIPLLANRFWGDAVARVGSKAVLGQAALAALARYDWPGNVRELQNVLAALAVSVPLRGVVPASAMPGAIAHATKIDARETLDAARRRFEERFVRAALARAAGHRGQTASALGVSRQGLAKLMQRLRLP
jgi:DNA-binding NtrC family response regulator/tetratricopeptide (TPR) repeat protein